MLLTYEAILEGNVLKWKGEAPKQVREQGEVAVYVTLLDEPVDQTKGRRMEAALAALAALPNRSIVDPLAWQQETRQERPLPRD